MRKAPLSKSCFWTVKKLNIGAQPEDGPMNHMLEIHLDHPFGHRKDGPYVRRKLDCPFGWGSNGPSTTHNCQTQGSPESGWLYILLVVWLVEYRWDTEIIQTRTNMSQSRPDHTGQDLTRQDETRRDQTRRDKTRPNKTRLDQTRPDQTRPGQTRWDQTRNKNRW